jgi:hypothetical protein
MNKWKRWKLRNCETFPNDVGKQTFPKHLQSNGIFIDDTVKLIRKHCENHLVDSQYKKQS